MSRLRLWFVWLLLINPVWVFASYHDSSSTPDKPGTELVNGLIDVMNSGDQMQMQLFITKQYTPSFLNRFSMQEHLEFLLNNRQNFGDLTFHAFRDYTDAPLPKNELHVVVKSSKTELFQGMILITEGTKPARIQRVIFGPARWPSNLEKLGSMSLKSAVTELDAYVERMANKDVFSGAILLAQGSELIYSDVHGMASKRFNVLNNLQTKFNIGSMNKMFTSVAIMQLLQAGKISLTDTLNQYADETWLPKSISEKIQIQHLLSHTSGLGSYFGRQYQETSKDKFQTLDDYKPLVIGSSLRFEPGEGRRYSNTGMLMLGVVIEQVSEQDYFDYIREHIYKPAGMIDSDSYSLNQPVPNLAMGYSIDRKANTGWRNNLYDHILKGSPAGGGFSTVEDLHRFALALTNHKLLDEAHTKMLYSRRPQRGFAVTQTPIGKIVGHNGGFQGISSNLDIYLDQGFVVVVLSNYDEGSRAIERKTRQLLERVAAYKGADQPTNR
ncbi:MAG: serine hydrolase [Alteromonadaceae bacterium]|nr:serine hydrolase [Alteromonadaceae bacterium]